MPALCIRFQEEDWFFAWEEELENDLETATTPPSRTGRRLFPAASIRSCF